MLERGHEPSSDFSLFESRAQNGGHASKRRTAPPVASLSPDMNDFKPNRTRSDSLGKSRTQIDPFYNHVSGEFLRHFESFIDDKMSIIL